MLKVNCTDIALQVRGVCRQRGGWRGDGAYSGEHGRDHQVALQRFGVPGRRLLQGKDKDSYRVRRGPPTLIYFLPVFPIFLIFFLRFFFRFFTLFFNLFSLSFYSIFFFPYEMFSPKRFCLIDVVQGELISGGCEKIWGRGGTHKLFVEQPGPTPWQKSYIRLSFKVVADHLVTSSGIRYKAFQKLPQIYTANHATFPIQMYAITVQICGNF